MTSTKSDENDKQSNSESPKPTKHENAELLNGDLRRSKNREKKMDPSKRFMIRATIIWCVLCLPGNLVTISLLNFQEPRQQQLESQAASPEASPASDNQVNDPLIKRSSIWYLVFYTIFS